MWLALPRTFWLLWLGQFVNRLGGFVLTFLPLFLTERHQLSEAQTGVMLSLYGFGGMVGASLGGLLSDRLGRKRTMLLGLIAVAVVLTIFGFVAGTVLVSVAAFAHGVCSATYGPAIQASVSDVVAPSDRMRAFGYLYWAVNLGFSVAASVGGFVAAHGYRWLFLGDAATNLAFAAIVALSIPETRPMTTGNKPRGALGAFAALSDLRFVAFAFAHFLVLLVFLQTFITLPLVERQRGVSTERIGLIAGLNGVLIVALQPFFVRLARGQAQWRILTLGALLVAGGAATAANISDQWGYVVCMTVMTLGEIAFSAAAPTFVAAIAPADQRGVYQGAHSLCWSAAALCAPLLGPGGLQLLGARTMWHGAVLVSLVAATAHAFATRRAETRSALTCVPAGAPRD